MKPRSVESCAAELQRRGFADAGIVRRREIARSIQEEKRRRDLEDYTFSHFAFPPEDAIDNENLLFEDKSGGCVLTPEVSGKMLFLLCWRKKPAYPVASTYFQPIVLL